MFNLCLYNKCRVFLDSSSWDEFEKRKKEPLAHLWFYTEPSVISQQCLKTSEKIFPTLTSFDVSIIFSFLHGVSKGWQEYTAVKVILYGSLCRKVCWSAEVHGNHDRAQGWASVFNAFLGYLSLDITQCVLEAQHSGLTLTYSVPLSVLETFCYLIDTRLLLPTVYLLCLCYINIHW